MSAFWIIPSVMSTMADPLARVMTTLAMIAKKAGISPAMFSPMLIMSAVTVGLGYFAYTQYESAEDAEEKARQAMAQAKAAEAGRDAALAAEQHCVSERKDLVAELNMIDAARSLKAEESLAASLARTKAVELAGAHMGSEETLKFDQQYSENTLKSIVVEMAALEELPPYIDRCLGMEIHLGQDLPRYLLLWNPDPELVCPEDYAAVEDGVARAGSWGLSSRARDEFGNMENAVGEDAEGIVTDPRMNDRWSSAAFVTGMRAIQRAILTADHGERPTVAPGQAQIWSLALWDTYNRMSSPANGVLNRPLPECIDDWLREVAVESSPAEEGQPVLPDLSAVALGLEVPMTPTAGCPWTSDGLARGSQGAIRATARMANLLLASSPVE